jgi:hypothetical protein
MNREETKLNKELDSLINEVKELGPMMRGSVTLMGKKNKQPYFSVGIKGKTKVMYLGDKRAKVAQSYSDNYKKMLEIVDKMTIINMQLLKLQEPK